jgi:outer membrane protein, multidrug efflux system
VRRPAAVGLVALLAGATHSGCRSYADKQHGSYLDAPESYPSSGGEIARDTARDVGELEQSEVAQLEAISAALPSYESFNDPVLVALIERALESSPNVATTLARIRLARAMADQARAARFPVVMASGALTRSSVIQGALGRVDISAVSVSLPIRWELDLYGRFASEHRAAKDLAEASELDFEAMQISLAASVAEAYMDLVGVRAERTLVDEQLETNSQYLELVRLRFETGLASAVDVHQQRQQVASLEAQRDLLEGQEAVSVNALMLIVGETEVLLDTGTRDKLPTIGEPPPHGVPASLFERRPDVRAAALRIEANDKRVRAAIVAQLPAVRVEFTPGYVSQRADAAIFGGPSTASGFQWTASAAMDVAIFNGLLGPATTNARRAEVDQAVAAYRQTFQNALIEVENSVVLDRQQRQAIANLERQLRFAEDTLTAARDRYQAGLSDFLPVLTALRTKQAAEQGLLAAHSNLVQLRIQLFRALGGVLEREDRR